MKKVKLIRQTTITECGVCCLSMVASYYGYKKPISYFRNQFSIGRDGTNIKEIYDIFDSIGMKADVYRSNKLEDFEFEKGTPYIVFCKNNHFITIQVDGTKVIVSDPSDNQKKVSLSELEYGFAGIIIHAKPNDDFVIESDKVDDFRHIKQIIKDSQGLLLLTLFLSIIGYAATIVVPVILQRIIDRLSKGDTLELNFLIQKLLVLFVVYFIVSLIRNRVNVILESKMLENITKSILYHLFKIPYSFFDNRSSGNILYRLGILDHLRNVISSSFIGMIMDSTCVICIICYVGYVFPFLILPIIVLILAIGIYIIFVGKRTIKLQKEELTSNESVNDLQTEIVTNMFQIKCLHLEEYFWGNFIKRFNLAKKNFINEKKFSSDISLIYSAANVFIPILLTLKCIYQNNLILTSGQVVLIYSLTGMLMNYTYNFFNQIITIYEMKVLVFYLNDMLDEPEVYKTGNEILGEFRTFNIENVEFKYNNKSKNIIENFNMDIKKGDKVAIVGLTGSGKTTIVKLIAGLYKPNKGKIKINGINFDNIRLDKLNGLMTIVPQIPIVFNKTIRDNITLEDESINDKKVVDALECACLLDDVSKMPMGLNTYISGQAGNLSGGQIQRLSLARALVRKPQLLIMDEATSSLDAITEDKIYYNLKKMGITTIIISHRLSTVNDADCIYYIEKGNLIESGKHKDLMCLCEPYKKLFEQQFVKME
ncbi:ABC transporter family protein [[Clostridium] bifermentans ATCC 19299]|uniref:peptidase domain-containing ABC transporter n=1 Tax=Paraclostridium bifermentans TaxID=1490 RepID=UPI00038D4BBA|nr:peptidase domain-containing ABC transporter [Paraclostridium bifermentans]EQK48708.1 ABC transporter family protein [[Clostridium] bifermentans ATCC 19299] [Paraclostridium bifermentans ATCC 19299]MCR1876775.1 peptidase domain-containing ABC transporter [Paraclostridium bifermentans]